jgi:phosphopantetheinyl transferase (holo-ACP synthase)
MAEPVSPEAGEGSQPSVACPDIHGPQGLGLEIANIAALPDAEDYSQDEFYRANFTPSEIAYCIKEPMAKAAFQKLLAAKRAVIKSGAINEPPEGLKGIEIGFDGEGRPFYPGCLLSLSCTGTIAAAACLRPGGPALPAAQAAARRAEPIVIPTRIRIVAALVALSLLVLFGIGLLKLLELSFPHR